VARVSLAVLCLGGVVALSPARGGISLLAGVVVAVAVTIGLVLIVLDTRRGAVLGDVERACATGLLAPRPGSRRVDIEAAQAYFLAGLGYLRAGVPTQAAAAFAAAADADGRGGTAERLLELANARSRAQQQVLRRLASHPSPDTPAPTPQP